MRERTHRSLLDYDFDPLEGGMRWRDYDILPTALAMTTLALPRSAITESFEYCDRVGAAAATVSARAIDGDCTAPGACG